MWRGEVREEWMSGTRERGRDRADKKDIVSREPVFDLVWTHFGFRIKDKWVYQCLQSFWFFCLSQKWLVSSSVFLI